MLGEVERERLRAILHQPPRAFGHARSTWTLALLAEVAQAEGLSASVLSIETIRQALLRLEVGGAGQALAHQPDAAYGKRRRDRLISLARATDGRWAEDEVWFSRCAKRLCTLGGTWRTPRRHACTIPRTRGEGAGLLGPVAARGERMLLRSWRAGR